MVGGARLRSCGILRRLSMRFWTRFSKQPACPQRILLLPILTQQTSWRRILTRASWRLRSSKRQPGEASLWPSCWRQLRFSFLAPEPAGPPPPRRAPTPLSIPRGNATFRYRSSSAAMCRSRTWSRCAPEFLSSERREWDAPRGTPPRHRASGSPGPCGCHPPN